MKPNANARSSAAERVAREPGAAASTASAARALALTVTRERIALALLAAIASARALVSIAPALRFDSDPALVPGAFAGIGPGASLLFDALGAAAIAFLAAARLRASRLDPSRASGAATAFLLLLPLPAFLLSVFAPDGSFADLWRGATWFVAALAAVVVAGTDRAGRAIVLGALAGMAAALLCRGASQLLLEHPAMVAEYERSRDLFLASRGWLPDSASALAYERRLRQSEATGWFGLSNVYSGVMVAAALLLGALAWTTRGPQRTVPLAGALSAVLALGAIVIVFINGSKGAIAVLAIGVAALATLLFASRTSSDRRRRWIPRVLALLLLLAPFTAFVRGAILGETSMGERSLLFRWQYLIGSLRIVVDDPITGAGAGGFQDAYARMRPWMSPEEVVSAHASFLDWIAMLGLGGVGLIALSVVLLMRGLRAPFGSAIANEHSESSPSPALMSALAAGLGSALAMAMTSNADLNTESMAMRMLALIAAVSVALFTARIVQSGDERIVSAGAGAAALAMLIHAQVDMAFWLPGSVWWCWLLLGVAAAGARPIARRFDRPALALFGVLAMSAALGLAIMSVRAGVQERTAERAALLLEQAAEAKEPLPRVEVSRMLADSAAVIPGNIVVWQAAIEQLLLSIDQLGPQETGARLARLLDARTLAEQALAARPERTTLRLLAEVRFREAMEWRRTRDGEIRPGPDSNDLDADQALITAIKAVIDQDPRSLPMWRRLVDAQLLIGDDAGAAQSAKRALEVNASYRLDPLRQLSERERTAFERLSASQLQIAPPPR